MSTTAPNTGASFGIPHLFLWGDFLERHPFRVASVPNVQRWYEALIKVASTRSGSICLHAGS